MPASLPEGYEVESAPQQSSGGLPEGYAVESTPPTGGAATAAAGGFTRGIPIVGPMLEAGAEKAAAKARSWLYGTKYEDELKAVSDYAKRTKEAHGTASTVGELGGGIGGTAVAGMAAPWAMGLSGSFPGMVARSALSGGAIGAADEAARGGDATTGGAIGAGAGAAGPIVGKVAGALATPVINTIRGLRNPEGEAARRVATAIYRDVQSGNGGLNLGEYANAAREGQPVNLMDIGGETTRALARSSANTSPEGRGVLNQAINDRFEGQATRLEDWLNNQFHFPDAPAQQEALNNVARGTNQAAYRGAERAADARFPQGIWSPELEQLTSSPDVVDAMKAAATRGKGRAVVEGYGGFNPGVTFENGQLNFRRGATGVPSYPDLRLWDYTYRNLRDAADAAFRRGENSLGGSLKGQANMLVQHLDDLVPEFGQARAGAARFFGANDALEAGQNFVAQRFNNRQAARALSSMSTTERQLFQDGFIDRFVQQVRASPDRRSILNGLGMNSNENRQKLELALGPQRARELETFLRAEGVMDTARRAVQGNSTTARQLMELGLAGGVGGSLSAANGGDFTTGALAGAALRHGLSRGSAFIDERVARHVANILTSQNSAQVGQHIRRIARNPTLFGSLQNNDAALGAVLARGVLPALQ